MAAIGKRLNRRTLLRGAGGVAVGLPFLNAMLEPGATVAQAGAIPKRVVFFFTSCGVVPDMWWPSGRENDFDLNGTSLEPLQPFRSKLLIPDGIEMRTAKQRRGDGGNGHDVGTAHCLTARPIVAGPSGVGEFGHLWDGTAGGISIDQHMANHFRGMTPYASLEFGVKAEGIRQSLPSRISYRAEGQPVIPMHTAGEAFDRVFAPLSGDAAAQAERRRGREAVLARVHGDLQRLRGQLGTNDRQRLDSHVSSIEDIQDRLSMLSGTSCDLPPRADSNAYEELGALQLDLIASAFTCDLTRVASIQWANGQSGVNHRWLGHNNGHHSISHKGITEGNFKAQSAEIDRWQAQQFAHLLSALDSVMEGDGQTLLDHTAVVWVNEQEQSIGNIHRWNRMPFIVAGGLGGYFRTGRKIELDSVPHANLYVNLMQGVGMTDTTFGEPDLCTGPISELT
ncbi:MAG: DUF1552 domain-containing protein [Myxococcota bacterium]